MVKLQQQDIVKLEDWTKKFFDSDEKDYKTFDISSEIDRSLGFEENKEILREKIKVFINEYVNTEKLTRKKAEIISKEEHQNITQQQLNKFEQQAEVEFNKCLLEIEKNKTTTYLEEVYYIPKQFTQMVIKENARGFLMYGESGLGKTYSVLRTFKELKQPFVLLNGHITSLELYNLLFQHKDEIIVLDDVNILDSEQNLNILKACLSDNSRIVQYHTTSSKLRVPSKFLFNGRLIILLNDLPRKTESLRAVESRTLNYELKISFKDKIKILFELATLSYKNLKEEERLEIVRWIKDKTSRATENLNLRLLFTCFEFYIFDKDNWKTLASKIIKNNEDLLLIVQGLSEQEWCSETGRHRATYYRLKQQVVEKEEKWKKIKAI